MDDLAPLGYLADFVENARNAMAHVNVTGADKSRNTLFLRTAERALIKAARDRGRAATESAALDVANFYAEGRRMKDRHDCAVRSLDSSLRRLGEAYLSTLPNPKNT